MTIATDEETRRSIDDISRSLLLGEPYFGHLLVGTVRATSNETFAARLLAHGHSARIEVGRPKWAGLSAAQRKTVLKHELLHLTFKHPIRARNFSRPELYGLACDLVVNQYLDPSELEDAVTLGDFAELGLEPNQTADHYYAQLLPLYERAARRCSGDGEPSRGEQALMSFCSGNSAACRSHDAWRSFETLPSSALSVLEANLDRLLEATVRRARSRKWGKLPGGLLAWLEAIVDRKNEVPWRRVLRLFASSSERTYVKNTISRPSKRYGTCPGIRIKRRTAVVVAVDTSGSVPDEDLATFFSEIFSMWRRGAAITILECDARVVREYAYKGVTPKAVGGRGGTAFDPAIVRANQLQPDALVYFTDGHAPTPAVRPRMPLLWVLSTEGLPANEARALPGRRVKLTRAAGGAI